jgi:hypothetical protein
VRGLGLLLAVTVVLGGCADPEAARLVLQIESAGRTGACDLAALAPVQMKREGDVVVFVDGTGTSVSVIWPLGFAAWLEYGDAVLYASDGSVVGREGDILDTIGGSAGADGFHVCKVGVRTYS